MGNRDRLRRLYETVETFLLKDSGSKGCSRSAVLLHRKLGIEAAFRDLDDTGSSIARNFYGNREHDYLIDRMIREGALCLWMLWCWLNRC